MKKPFDIVIFISSEDDKYNVAGGIGTYIGVLSRAIKEQYSDIEVYWITKSNKERDIQETDKYGVVRTYLVPAILSKDMPFSKLCSKNIELNKQIMFNSRLEDKILEILQANKEKKIMIESGEWEGHAGKLFKLINDSNIVKIARLHTPIATCIRQNNIPITPEITYQLINEYEVIKNANIISACTEHVKSMVAKDVIGENHPLISDIKTIPNPIDIRSYADNGITTEEGIEFINGKLRKEFFNKDTRNIIILGSVETRKGVEKVIDAIPGTIDKVSNARFCFVGHNGDSEETLTANSKIKPKQLLSRIDDKYHEYVEFTGYIDHSLVPKVIAAGSIFPILSLNDNFPGTVAEIALSGKTILALRRGGVEEMLSDHGEFLAYDLGKSNETVVANLVKGIVELDGDDDEIDRIGQECKNLVLRKYKTKSVLNKMFETYSNLRA